MIKQAREKMEKAINSEYAIKEKLDEAEEARQEAEDKLLKD
jgi:hypothetical protein